MSPDPSTAPSSLLGLPGPWPFVVFSRQDKVDAPMAERFQAAAKNKELLFYVGEAGWYRVTAC